MAYSDENLQAAGDFFGRDTREKVGVIVRDRDNKLLIVEGKTGKHSLPKGGRFCYETEYEGALRECWEETGLDLWHCTPERTVKLVWGTYYFFRLPVSGKTLTLVPQPGECVKVLWKNPGGYWLKEVAVKNIDLFTYVRSCKKSKAFYFQKKRWEAWTAKKAAGALEDHELDGPLAE
jgi:8-oxo-dGTP pyrophosphatase MutT (NUDIX family)